MKIVSPWGRLHIARAKDGEGVYHPVGEMKVAVHWFDQGSSRDDEDDIRREPFDAAPDGILSPKLFLQAPHVPALTYLLT